MDGTIHFACDQYRGDLAWVRKVIALNRAGRDLSVRLKAAIPGAEAAVDVFIRPSNVWLVGFRAGSVAVKFQDTNPTIDGVDFTRTLPFSPNYSILGAWNESLAYSGQWAFHNAIQSLGSVTKNSHFGKQESRGLILAIFAVCEAIRFWRIDKAIAEAICGQGTFRFIDWKEDVNNWDKLSRGDQRGALAGVQLPSV